MIQIDVTMQITKEYTGDILTLQLEHVDANYAKVFSFFEQCVNQELVLNFIDKARDGETDITSYFSLSKENAQIFEQRFQDLSAEFSMRKLWNEKGFETSITIKEVEFNLTEDPNNTIQRLGTLIDKDEKTIWGIDFPSSYNLS